jgi:transcriptional regulator with XRE-family HTH domain
MSNKSLKRSPLGTTLMYARMAQKLTIYDVMAKSGLSRNTIIDVEADRLVIVNDLLLYVAAIEVELRFSPPNTKPVIGCDIEILE